MDTNDLNIANQLFNEKFRSYRKSKFDVEDTENEKIREINRERLVNEEIRPFLQKYIPKLSKKKKELEEFLINENKSDNDIISIFNR